MTYKQPVSALVVIYTPALDVLLLERADYPGYWQSVTGSRDGDESLRETALREVGEETGLDAAHLALTDWALTDWQVQNVYDIYAKWLYRYPPGTTQNTEHVFGLELPARLPVKVAPREHLGYQWLPWREAADKVFSPSNRAAILQLPQRAIT